jgi:ABC-type branched-subunit amino acid transport system substrate-binding protein
VYLLSFQPETEVRRVVSYAVSQGRKNFAALVPSTAYGRVSESAFRDAVSESGGTISVVQHFSTTSNITDQVSAIKSGAPDALFLPQGGSPLRTVASELKDDGLDTANIKLLGTGLWDDPANGKEEALRDSWFAAPAPNADRSFVVKYREAFGSAPPQLAALAYDAVSLAALIGAGEPYHRFTQATLTDPNGFSGVDGIFRFRENGSVERGLSVLAIRPGGFEVVSPAPQTFEHKGS